MAAPRGSTESLAGPGSRTPNGSNPDLQDYYDKTVPPPHGLSGIYSHSPLTGSDTLGPALPSTPQQPVEPESAPLTSQPRTMNRDFYSNIEEPKGSPWLQQQEAKSKRSRLMITGGVLALIAIVAIAAGVGVGVSHHGKSTQNLSSGPGSGSTSGSGSGGSGTGGTPSQPVDQPNPNDPSNFVKDPRLHQSFYGMAYTPAGSQLPACGNSLADVITDIQLISQLTKRIRLYGADCNQSALVLEAIKQTKVDMQVYLAIYNIPTDSTPYTRQKSLIVNALQTYGADNVAGVTVGNEFMLNYLTDNGGGDDPNSAVGNAGAALLVPNITDMRNTLRTMGLSNIPVGNSDAGSYFNSRVLAASDYGMANVHPWFAQVTAQQAANWTEQFFVDTDIAAASAVPNNPKMYIAETGWPTQSSDAAHESNGASDASIANLQVFLDTFVCDANTKGIGYFFFEYFDETWKVEQFGGVEGWWGLFNSDRTLKAVTIPDCASP